MKQCSRCKTVKSLEFFYKDKNNIDGYQYRCKDCAKNEAVTYKQQASKNTRRRQVLIYNKFHEIKSYYGCACCDETEPSCLEFHHLDPKNKDSTINKLIFSPTKLMIEINKCILLCANCHRKVHNNKITIISRPIYTEFNKILNLSSKLDRVSYCVCGKKKIKQSNFCKHCFNSSHKPSALITQSKNYHKFVHPDRETLKRLVWDKPVSKIAKEFGVVDNTIHKLCKKYQIETPCRGYWQKLYAKIM